MKDLIEAFNIFYKYTDKEYPINCSHDLMYVDVNPEEVSKEDIKKLDNLGFFIYEEEGFGSFKYGSC